MVSSDGTVASRVLKPQAKDTVNTASELDYGERDLEAEYKCDSSVTGITCRVVSGPGRGFGFLLNTDGLTKLRREQGAGWPLRWRSPRPLRARLRLAVHGYGAHDLNRLVHHERGRYFRSYEANSLRDLHVCG